MTIFGSIIGSIGVIFSIHALIQSTMSTIDIGIVFYGLVLSVSIVISVVFLNMLAETMYVWSLAFYYFVFIYWYGDWPEHLKKQ